MVNIVRMISTEIQRGRRIVKLLIHGRNDTRTTPQAGPYGIDSHPIEDMVAIYARSTSQGKDVCIGYINKNAIAEIGEFRIFSTDASGTVKTFIHLKNNGVMQLGGDADFAVRYSKLEEAFNQLKSDFNSLVQSYNSHVHPGVSSGGASTGTTPTISSQSNANISPAKIETIKTP